MDRNAGLPLIVGFPGVVALRKESVDRNKKLRMMKCKLKVALRKESVDRNATMQIVIIVVRAVALRKESVDRNARKIHPVAPDISSLSARRAWIEMPDKTHQRELFQSLSARRAWIEMIMETPWRYLI